MKEVTDPSLLSKLEGREVSDPNVLAQLEGRKPDALDNPNDAYSAVSGVGLSLLDTAKNLGVGAIYDAAKLGNLINKPGQYLADKISGKSQSSNEEARSSIDAFAKEQADPESLPFKAGQLTTDIAATAGVGPVLAGAVRAFPALARFAPSLVPALESGGFRIGLGGPTTTSTTLAGRAADLATRTGAGAAVGGASAGIINPDHADTGALIGGVLPPAARVVGAAGGVIGRRVANRVAEGAAEQSRNATRDATLHAAQDAGYVVPPSTINPTWLTNRMEGVAGKAALGQEVSIRNQEITDSLARRALGLPENTPLSGNALELFRRNASAPYREVAALPAMPPQRTAGIGGYPLIGPARQAPAEALHDLQQARFESNAAWREYRRTGEVAARDRARGFDNNATTLETYLEQTAVAAGRPDLVPALRQARQRIAQSYEVERALNTSTGQVDAKVLGKAIDNGKPLTGDLETIARFADAFPQFAREGLRVPAPGVSKLEGIMGSAFGASGAAAMGPWGLLAGTIPLVAPPVTRAGLLSGVGQAALATPHYGPTGLTQLISRVPGGLASLSGNTASRSLAYQSNRPSSP